MHLIADTVVKIISNKNKEAPMVHLHVNDSLKYAIYHQHIKSFKF